MNAVSDAIEPGVAPTPGQRWFGCECCGLVSRLNASDDTAAAPAEERSLRCPRCDHPLHWRKPASLQRTWAFVITAAVLYVPANLLPIMRTTQAFRSADHTLLGGIAELWHDGAYGLSLIVFIASIAVPLLKIGALALLAWSVERAPHWRRQERAQIFSLVETVGHWSMLDVYVVVLLAGMVRFDALASASAGPGLPAFAAVVVLTMLAAHSFDSRLIWREPGTDD